MHNYAKDLQIAKVILDQLGANRFAMMTGAKNFTTSENGLQFHIPRSNGINRISIVLDIANDLYNAEFGYQHGVKYTVKKVYKGIYCDALKKLFEQETRLRASL